MCVTCFRLSPKHESCKKLLEMEIEANREKREALEINVGKLKLAHHTHQEKIESILSYYK